MKPRILALRWSKIGSYSPFVLKYQNKTRNLGTLAVALIVFYCFSSSAALEDARNDLLSGNYESAIEQAEEGMDSFSSAQDWTLVMLEAQMALGRYEDAAATLATALRGTSYSSIRVRLEGYDIYRHLDRPDEARQMVMEIDRLAGGNIYSYRTPEDFVALGGAAVILGADPSLVLENFYEQAKEADPELRSVYLAIGNLALSKNDFSVASRNFQQGLEKFPADPDFHYGLAKSFQSSDQRAMLENLQTALDTNERHVPSYLLLADHLINAEEFDAADEAIDTALETNPRSPNAWAYKAVIAHFKNNAEAETEAIEKALETWTDNPEVYHITGRKLSQRYRFTEGAEYQRKALEADPEYLPAKIQLAQDLLRLGKDEEGWQLAQEVYENDGYNVSAYNLVTLKDSLDEFTTLRDGNFIVRMGKHDGIDEAKLYGDRVMELLKKAEAELGTKYALELSQPVTVEIFPNPKDFGVRTFGIPDNPGYLGVCFGSVITANSPASQGQSPANWEAVLWHEFCHVITLSLTKNKMPRWLSEGISVYEERLENPTWGQWMNRDYRVMIENGELTPVGELSSAFLAPESNLHLQFAYYQSSIVVEYMVQEYGLQSMRNLLVELADGTEINTAIEKYMAPISDVEAGFDEFAKMLARDMAPDLDFEKPGENPFVPADSEIFATMHANNYWVMMEEANALMSDGQWEEAKEPLQELIEMYPRQTEPDNAYVMLATVHRNLGEIEEEKAMLEKIVSLIGDAYPIHQRLMELEAEAGNWPEVALQANKYLAINPLLPMPYRYLADAAEETDDRPTAISAYRSLLELDPADPAQVHFRLGSLLDETEDPDAKRHILQTLEEAPRFREAHELLIEILNKENTDNI